jgi:hypothetical protein
MDSGTAHRDYHSPVVAYVDGIADRRVVVAGHSLGGGLAKMVGAHARRPAVSFSGPGVLDSTRKLNLSAAFLHRHMLNVVPDRDLVSTVGTMEGTVATWACPLDFVTCHYPTVQLCHLLALCPDALPGLECTLRQPPPRPLRHRLAAARDAAVHWLSR